MASSNRVNKSDVWRSFTKVGAAKVRCNLCSRELASPGGQTTGMHAHLRSKHPGVDTVPSKTTPITGYMTSRNCPESRSEKISNALALVSAHH